MAVNPDLLPKSEAAVEVQVVLHIDKDFPGDQERIAKDIIDIALQLYYKYIGRDNVLKNYQIG